MELPPHVQMALGVVSPITEGDLAVHEGAGHFAQETFGLSGVEFASAATNATSGTTLFSIVPAKRVPLSWKYLEITLDGTVECAGVCTPANGGGPPPTAASQILVCAWFYDQTLLNGSNIAPQKVVRSVKAGFSATAFPVRLFNEWAEVCPLLDGCVSPPVWVTKTQIQIKSTSRIQLDQLPGFRFQELFVEAASEVKTKWRYLSLYRIFEHGYLSEVFETLKSTFFASPKESLAVATTSLDSELNQFLALVKNAGLDNHFAMLVDEFDKAKVNGNRFAAALEHSIHQSGQIKLIKGKEQKGVLICYKIRCAIVHAGMSSQIFDAYPDGPACLELLLPVCESAVLQFVGLTAH
jgi:hypothetical protein